MFICVCNAVTDGQVRQCIGQGVHSVSAIKRQLEFKSCCGRCTCHIRDLISEHKSQLPVIQEYAHAR